MKETVIKVNDVKKFIAPLRNLVKSVDSIVMSVKDETIAVNTRTEDASQVVNILFTKDIVSVDGDIEKFGIYNLNEFLSVLTLSDGNSLELVVSGNLMTIHYGEKAKIEYILSDLSLITEGPTELKAKVDFLAEFEVNNDFIKKVKSISNTISASILKIKSEDGILSYSIINKNSQSHSFTEEIGKGSTDDFEVSISIKDDKRDNFGFLYENCNYKFTVSTRVIKVDGITEEYGMLRYYLAPLA